MQIMRMRGGSSYLSSESTPHIPQDKIDEVVTRLSRPESPILEVNNRQFHRFVNDGVPVDLRKGDRTVGDFVKIIDFEHSDNNTFSVVNQFTVQGKNGSRRPDIVAFINGFPIAVLELKNPADEEADIWKAFAQIETYKEELPDLFTYNLASIMPSSPGFGLVKPTALPPVQKNVPNPTVLDQNVPSSVPVEIHDIHLIIALTVGLFQMFIKN